MNQQQPRLPGSVDKDSGTNIHDLTDATCRLRSVTAHIDSFLTGQLQRLSDAMHVYTKIRTEAESVRRLFSDLEFERQQFETQRDNELERLQRASNNLIAAWEQLDAQQRQLLLDPRRSDSNRPKLQVASSKCRSDESDSMTATSHLPEQVESTLLEIQLLKREIVSHAQRRK